jgi:hypothetical protein
MTITRCFLIVWLLLQITVCRGASRFDGTWWGTFDSQPTELLPDGSYPQKVNAFELRLHERKGAVTGEFERRGTNVGPAQRLMYGKLFGDRACFDVITEETDMRWCLVARGNRLTGTWSNGPEGGPLLDGAGVGARLFKIAAQRVPAE